MPTRPTEHETLHHLFHPRAVAVIDASDDATRHGYIVLTNLRNAGFTGGIPKSQRFPGIPPAGLVGGAAQNNGDARIPQEDGYSRRLTAIDITPVIPGRSGIIAVDALLEPTT